MIYDLSPETRRIIIQFAAKENLSFQTALECLAMEGFKALGSASYERGQLVNKSV